MILPIVATGDSVLRKVCKDIDKEYPNLKELVANMFESMYNSYGVGLAAPQIGKAIRLFIVDTEAFADNDDYSEEEQKILKNFKRVFINAKIIKEEGEPWEYKEGCLSIPDVHEEVVRRPIVTIEYMDENFNKHTDTLTGLPARVVQHEYDHLEGILFTDKISSFKKRILKRKLENISKGNIEVEYAMRFPKAKK